MSLLPGTPRFARDLDAIAKFYPVAAEGIVVADGPYAWRFTPTREYRGAKQASYRIELASDCSIDPQEMARLVGKRVFLLLNGGPERYEAQRCVNLQPREVEGAIRQRIKAACTPR